MTPTLSKQGEIYAVYDLDKPEAPAVKFTERWKAIDFMRRHDLTNFRD